MSLINGLAQGLDIRFSQVVRGVAWSSSGVRVTTSSGVFDADRVVVTLPLGVLKRGDIEFSPGLPKGKRTAIARLGMGVLDKSYFKFPTAFWQTGEDPVWIYRKRWSKKLKPDSGILHVGSSCRSADLIWIYCGRAGKTV